MGKSFDLGRIQLLDPLRMQIRAMHCENARLGAAFGSRYKDKKAGASARSGCFADVYGEVSLPNEPSNLQRFL